MRVLFKTYYKLSEISLKIGIRNSVNISGTRDVVYRHQRCSLQAIEMFFTNEFNEGEV
jgi:hypothetical protein